MATTNIDRVGKGKVIVPKMVVIVPTST